MQDKKLKKRVNNALAIGAAIFILAIQVVAGFGCGNAQLPSDGQSGGTIASGGAALDEPAMTAQDLQLEAGNIAVFWANNPGTPEKVSFDFNGPWDFSTGPTASTLTIATISKDIAPDQARFPDADVAARLSWNPSRGPDEYNFQAIDESSWRSYGKTGSRGVVVYSDPAEALKFPCRVGTSWSSVYTRSEGGTIVGILENEQVVGYNKLILPAGTFDAFLLQSRVASSAGEKSTITWDYIWFVPGIGRAAEVVSQADEKGPLFTNAYAVYRLKQY